MAALIDAARASVCPAIGAARGPGRTGASSWCELRPGHRPRPHATTISRYAATSRQSSPAIAWLLQGAGRRAIRPLAPAGTSGDESPDAPEVRASAGGEGRPLTEFREAPISLARYWRHIGQTDMRREPWRKPEDVC